jgi:ATP-dependent Clp protease ATP-binding subunit ClpC
MMRVLQTKESYLEQSGYRKALALEKLLSRSRAGLVAVLSGSLALLSLVFAIAFMARQQVAWLFLGGFEIFLGLFFLSLIGWLFTGYLHEDLELSPEDLKKAWEHQAYGKNLSFFAAQILNAASTGSDFQVPKVFEFLVKTRQFLWVLKRLAVDPQVFIQKVREHYPPGSVLSLAEALKRAWEKALGVRRFMVHYGDVLDGLYELDEIFRRIIFDFELEEADLDEVIAWQSRREVRLKQKGKFWDRANLLNTKGIGKDWAGGFTINLDRTALDLTRLMEVRPAPLHLFGHRENLETLERILVTKSNAVMVGPSGVGRHTLLQALATKMNWGQTFGPLRYQRLLQIDSGAVIAGAVSLNEIVERIQYLFGEALAAENVILVVNDIDAFLDPEPEAGRINATEAILPFLQSPLKIIGITTSQGYQTTIGKNPQLARFFEKLELAEPSEAETLMVLEGEVGHLETRSNLFFTYKALKEIVKLATKLIQNLPNPEKSLEIMEETAVYVATKSGERIVLPEHVQKVVTIRTKVPVEKVAGEEKDILLNLEEILHERIIGQEEAITELANALRRARSGVRSEKRPIGVFLFLGPTGVGKTETTKALASVYFGSEQRIIRFDMSEYQELHAINRLIGDADARTGGLLTEAIIASPFSLILLDELEKAHPKILDLFLQVFDEGRLTDALGRTVSFVNAMIIATSNAGAELIREMVKAGQNPALARDQLLDYLQKQGIYRPEFLNRFDAVLIFRPLSEAELTQVAVLLLGELNARLAAKEVQIDITPELAQAVARGGFSPEFGARPLRRFIQENIENFVARGLLSGEIQRGQVVEIDPALFQKS